VRYYELQNEINPQKIECLWSKKVFWSRQKWLWGIRSY